MSPSHDQAGYDSIYREFDSPLMQRVRAEAYGEDIGQHSWVTAEELRRDIGRLDLRSTSELIDLGCGPAGPLTFVVRSVGCHGTGLDASDAALGAGHRRVESLGLAASITLREADLDTPLPFASGSFDAAMALDVVLHLRDRAAFYREVARILRPGARFLVTDAGIVTGAISAEEVRRRSPYTYTAFAAHGQNEALLESAGFEVLEVEERTSGALRNASGRLAAIHAHRAELVETFGAAQFAAQEAYLSVVAELSVRRALGRVMYLATRR